MPSGWNWWHSQRDFSAAETVPLLGWCHLLGRAAGKCPSPAELRQPPSCHRTPPSTASWLFLRIFTVKHRRQSTGSFWMCPGIRQRLLGLKPVCLLCVRTGLGWTLFSLWLSGLAAHRKHLAVCGRPQMLNSHQASQTRISVGLGKGIALFNLSR